ncbi:MAG: ATPase [Bacteroidetes bacterium GWF2_42_66]|nr:MAG: ATPase [Bacteroidetes bacterium GWA2_42_15]OFX98227.1 MAG: ATPase [Bacteroidetes bacterium GWE2_42_39]OFY42610.1 MAG: ATPase [Bacteroidetes bacterium GWF2_42_66]HAZ03019.1 ATPase [Marinilabiliales bacterium]HBL74331.1 ATPase [Prolixibacteraceae bacterium]
MERIAMKELISWKNRPGRKPLIIRGARQVGKTWLMKEFGKKEYRQTVYVNFESSKLLETLFIDNFDINRIITAIQIETAIQVNSENTLIIFDEIQEAEGAITSLKYFYENAPQYHIIAAGSLLGVAMHKHTSFPVGKVEFLDLYPLNYTEFLLALDQQPLLDLLKSKDWILIKSFKEKYIQILRQYYYIGGMPEAVLSYRTQNDFKEVRVIQKRILTAYEHDFSKHAPSDIVPRIRMLWNSIPSQLAKENKKFVYGAVKSGSRAKDYELALSWLIDCGLVHKVCRVSKPGIPLKAYEDYNAFKLFIVDVGLMGAMGDIDVRTLLEGNMIFEEFKGALTEQYVLQQLITIPDLVIYYWSAERSTAEIDFLIQYSGEVVPIEVKAEENLQAKSLKTFCQKYLPQTAIRTSMSDFRTEGWLTNLPLYSINELTGLFHF